MVNTAAILAINQVLKKYFEKYRGATPVPAKDLMPQFIAAGIFPADHKNGLPIRNILRQLDKAKQLHLIPYALPIRKQKNTNWFFTAKSGSSIVPATIKQKKSVVKKSQSLKASDEAYVIDLCDEILKAKALRQHKFDFLVGDKSSAGLQRRLPVDAFYPSLNLVVEYREVQHTKPVSHFDKPHIKTVSGVHRGEQRRIYDQRRRDILPKHGIKLVEIQYSQLKHDSRGRLLRNKADDLVIIKKLLNH